MNDYKLIAHRGYSWIAPENTLSAYQRASEAGFKYVECDIQFTKDNRPVLLHDTTINRTSNGKGFISGYTYEELNNYEFGGWRFKEYVGEPLLTFTDFIKFCKDHKLHPYIELKKELISNDNIKCLIEITKSQDMLKHVSWISSNPINLKKILSFDLSARVGVIGRLTNNLIKKAYQLKNESNEVFLDISRKKINYNILFIAELLELDVEVWTVDHPFQAHKLIKRGVKGITTNRLNNEKILNGNIFKITI